MIDRLNHSIELIRAIQGVLLESTRISLAVWLEKELIEIKKQYELEKVRT